MRKLTIAVLMGGRTAEHEISLASGKMVARNLDRAKYRVIPVVISRGGRWRAGAVRGGGRSRFLPVGEALSRLLCRKIDCVFIAMHGPYGEDGTIQGMMEMLDIPYTGSDVCASALAMDKPLAKEIYRSHGIPTPPSLVIEAAEWRTGVALLCERVRETVGYPCILKPARLGSSVGLALCRNEAALRRRLPLSLRYDRRILAESLVEGAELTCAVLDTAGGHPPIALPPTEIVPRTREFFDYHAKYTPGATAEITPARIGKSLTATVQDLALRAHRALGCTGMSRTDMIAEGKQCFVLETNTIPGMTKMSLLPQAARAAGMAFPAVLDRIIAVAIEAHRDKKHHHRSR